MKRLDDLRWEITDPALERLNIARTRLNVDSDFHDYHTTETDTKRILINPLTIERIRRRIRDIKKQIESVNPQTNFDRIVLMDIKDTVHALDIYHAYFNPRDVDDAFENGIHFSHVLSALFGSDVYGRGVYTTILDMIREIDYKTHERYTGMRYKFDKTAFDHHLERIREKARELLPGVIDIVKSFIKEIGICDQDSEKFLVELAPITDDCHSYSIGMNYLTLDASGFQFQKSGDRTKVYMDIIYLVALHEYGHRLQEFLAERALPYGTHSSSDTRNELIHGPASEATSMMLEKMSLSWLAENKKHAGLTNRDIELMKMYKALYIPSRLIDICHHIFEQKQHESQGEFNAHLELAKLTKMARYYTDPNILTDIEVMPTLEDINYIMGHVFLNKFLKELRGEYGTGFVRKNMPVIMKGMLISSDFRPDAFREFMLTEYFPKTLD